MLSCDALAFAPVGELIAHVLTTLVISDLLH
jgi:hypothetical protein